MAAELTLLDPQQQLAATVAGNVVVRAGPGSGKTRTLVARAGYLLEAEVSRFRGVACITYTNAAADEVRHRLRRLGVITEQRLTCSTLHAFCLNNVLRAFAPLTGAWLPAAGQVLDEAGAVDLLQRCFDDLGIGDLQARYRLATATKIRRAIACHETTDSFDPREIQAARRYELRLEAAQAVDFEAMVIRALRVVRSHEGVRDLLRARYPHLIVDEYQDLGGVLHQLVLALRDQADITVSAVGDADQSVFGFTGADPRYIDELASRPDFASVELQVNYRSGQAIIQASEAALGRRGRRRRAAEGLAAGNVEVSSLVGVLELHA
ncbi:MAG: ATP-dependent helicase UvrD/PcrA, partial [Thermoleophilaceae bacterium]|nr:ATP-dependent helicase UvrD/PcrA [Thermoleophilaceae bacterium]